MGEGGEGRQGAGRDLSSRCVQGDAPADGEPCSANVPRPAASSLISLRKAPHRRERWAVQSLIGEHQQRVHVPRTLGASRSEIKEEPKAGDIRGGKYPVAWARALNKRHPKETEKIQK
ncbi:hypothetical protein D3C86_1848620 [compost metagenome]